MSEQRMIKSRLKVILAERNAQLLREGRDPYTQRKLAEEVDLSLSVISALMTNRTKRIDFETLDKLCKQLECQPGDLLVYTAEE